MSRETHAYHMEIGVWVALGASIAALVAWISVILGIAPRLRESGDLTAPERPNVLDLATRTLENTRLLAEQRVRLDILDLRATLGVGTPIDAKDKRLEAIASNDVQRFVAPRDITENISSQELTNTEREIFDLLRQSPLSSTEVRVKVGKSREHVARSLRRLYDMGLVVRDDGSRPYRYRVT